MTKENLDRFKFRWFDTSLNFMAEVIFLDVSDDYAVVRYSFSDKETPNDEIKLSKGILMQSTGLRDKNGKLIYEGDIVEYNEEFEEGVSETMRDVVEYDNRLGALVCGGGDWALDKTILSTREIIGNIYENPELLEEINK